MNEEDSGSNSVGKNIPKPCVKHTEGHNRPQESAHKVGFVLPKVGKRTRPSPLCEWFQAFIFQFIVTFARFTSLKSKVTIRKKFPDFRNTSIKTFQKKHFSIVQNSLFWNQYSKAIFNRNFVFLLRTEHCVLNVWIVPFLDEKIIEYEFFFFKFLFQPTRSCFCFSHMSRQVWWTNACVPLQLHGRKSLRLSVSSKQIRHISICSVISAVSTEVVDLIGV